MNDNCLVFMKLSDGGMTLGDMIHRITRLEETFEIIESNP